MLSTPESSLDAPSTEGARRFCQSFMALAVFSLVAISVTNYCVNPFAQYPTTCCQPLVQTSRAQKVDLLTHFETAPEGIVLGSSRVLKLEPDYLEQRTGYRFFNAGVNYGRTEDFLALLRYYRDTFARAPKMVVVGLDVNSFTNGSPPDARLLSNSALVSRIPESITFADRMQRWRELLSWQQTKSSFDSVARHLMPAKLVDPAESFRGDGLIVYREREKELSMGTYDFQSAIESNKDEYKRLFRAFTELSTNRCRAFDELAKMCHDQGTTLIVFLTPMHPELIDYLTASTSYLDRKREVTHFIQREADRHGFEFRNLSLVGSFAGDPRKFVDGIHPLEPNTRRMIDRILIPQPSASEYVIQ